MSQLLDDREKVVATLVARHGEMERARIERGVRQVSALWREEDGDAAALGTFLSEHFVPRGEALDGIFAHLERTFEHLFGALTEVSREMRWASEIEDGPLLPIDHLMAEYDPFAHVVEDLFKGKVGFVVLANFALTTLAERERDGARWTRREWAEARLARVFSKRVPPEVNVHLSRVYAKGEAYVAQYDIWMHHVLTADGRRLFPKGTQLLSHWRLRDELKGWYGARVGSSDNGCSHA